MQKAVLIICISLSKLSFAMQTLADGSGSLANNPSLNSSNSNSTYPSLGSRIKNNLPSTQSTIDTLNANAAGVAGGIIGERLVGDHGELLLEQPLEQQLDYWLLE